MLLKSYALTRYAIILPTVLVLCQFLYCQHSLAGTPSKDGVVDLATAMDISSVGNQTQNYVYSINQEKVLCLRFKNGSSGLWNPATDQIKTSINPFCQLPEYARPLNQFIKRLVPGSPLPVSSMPEIYTIYDPSIEGNCGSIFGHYETIVYPDHRTFSFYLIGRVSKQKVFTRSAICNEISGSAETVYQTFVLVTGLSYFSFAPNSILVFSNYSDTHMRIGDTLMSNIALEFSSGQVNHIVSFGNNTFIVPADILYRPLQEAGMSPIKRYKIVEGVINGFLKKQDR